MKRSLTGLVIGLAIGSASLATAASQETRWHSNSVLCWTVNYNDGPGIACRRDGSNRTVTIAPGAVSIGTHTRLVTVTRGQIVVAERAGDVLWYGSAG